jgi:hypothetical protein
MMIVFIIYMFLIFLEIYRNYYIIEIKKRRPVYWRSTWLRLTVGAAFWFGSLIFSSMPYWSRWGMIPMMVLTFWFVFDYGLNIVRKKKPFFYLNPNGSWLDKFQYNSTGTFSWFWWKLFLMIGGLLLYFKGLDFAWTVKW